MQDDSPRSAYRMSNSDEKPGARFILNKVGDSPICAATVTGGPLSIEYEKVL